jgi:hypothetical protein
MTQHATKFVPQTIRSVSGDWAQAKHAVGEQRLFAT